MWKISACYVDDFYISYNAMPPPDQAAEFPKIKPSIEKDNKADYWKMAGSGKGL